MDLVALRERWTEELRAVNGSEWVEDHAACSTINGSSSWSVTSSDSKKPGDKSGASCFV